MVAEAPVTKEDKTAFLDLMREVHGVDAVPAEAPKKAGGQVSLAKAAARIFHGPKLFDVDGQRVWLREPKVAQLKRLLGVLTTLDEAEMVKSMPEFQTLMLGCLDFEGDAPADREAWFDELGIDDGFALIEAFAESMDLSALMARVNALAGKLNSLGGGRGGA